MGKNKTRIFKGKRYKFFSAYSNRINAEKKAKIIKERGIKKGDLRVFYKNTRIIKILYENKINPRPYFLFVWGKYQSGKSPVGHKKR